MADFTKTISNSIACLGNSPTTKWGSGTAYVMTWGSSKWGEGTETMLISFGKAIANTVTISDAMASKQVDKAVTLGSISPTYEGSEETLQDGNGYFYVFPRPTTDADERYNPSYTSGSASSQSWTCLSVSVVTWS